MEEEEEGRERRLRREEDQAVDDIQRCLEGDNFGDVNEGDVFEGGEVVQHKYDTMSQTTIRAPRGSWSGIRDSGI